MHKNLTVLRSPPEVVDAKLATVSALVALHPPWAQMWAARTPSHALRTISAGWGCIWRLAYLLATGQAGSSTLFTALRASHAPFNREYPDYPQWLDGCEHGVQTGSPAARSTAACSSQAAPPL